ncbi:hypothetical protein ACQY0O_008008 [Thecaphora frezii]
MGGASAPSRDLDHSAAWANFDFGGDFDLNQSTPGPPYLGSSAAGQGSPPQGRSETQTSKPSAAEVMPAQGGRSSFASPDSAPQYASTHHGAADGSARVQGYAEWSATPRPGSGFANGISAPAPRNAGSADMAQPAVMTYQTPTPRDLPRPIASSTTEPGPVDAGATYDSSLTSTPKASGSANFYTQQQQQRQQPQPQPQPQPQRLGRNSPAWDRPAVPFVHRPFSSADAYNQPDTALEALTEGRSSSSRPETAASHASGDGWAPEGAENRSSYSTNYSATTKQAKRASVLSFQTAMSGGGLDGFVSGDEDYEEAAEVAGRPIATNLVQNLRESIQPWLQSASNGYASSPDERSFPGALPTSAWADAGFRNSASSPASRSIPLRGPHKESPLTAPSALPAAPPAEAFRQQVAPPVPPKATPSVEGPRPPPIQTPLSRLSIPQPSSAAGPASSTIGPSSDDAGQTAIPDSSPRRATMPVRSSAAWDEALPPASGPARRRSAADEVLSDDVLPPPLPDDVAMAAQRSNEHPVAPVAPAAQKPVSDFRRKPLANMDSPEPQIPDEPGRGGAGVGIDATWFASESKGGAAASATVANGAAANAVKTERSRSASSASLLPTAALAQPPPAVASTAALLDRATSPSLEAPSREPSPPPDGEVEARAEWERTQMKRKQKKGETTRNSRNVGTLRGQLKPLQLVPADTISAAAEEDEVASPVQSQDATRRDLNGARRGSGSALDSASGAKGQPASSSNAVVSTQQLQRNQAREQRRSIGAFSASMAAANAVSGGSNGPYPVFTSPPGVVKKGGARQYPGSMPQRSLVPPFELQNRPDGLPSGLIGPDGVRRSINDPEVCLECMMRDEDMIDVQVIGEGIWERESDREFHEALRLEAEETARQQRAATDDGDGSALDHSSAHGSSSQRHPASSSERAQSRNSLMPARPVKKIGKGEPLTTERLKLHTQMNPPASSHRWRTLQTFLAVQAKYIAMEHQKMKLEADRRRSAIGPNNVTATDPIGAAGPDSGRRSPIVPAGVAREASSDLRNRSSSGSLLKNAIVTDNEGLSPVEREEKLRDIASARATRYKMAGVMASDPLPLPPSAVTAAPQPVPSRLGPYAQQPPTPLDDGDAPLPSEVGLLPAMSVAGRSVSAGRRAASTQELRPPSGSASSPALYPSSPAESLAPPFRPFAPNSPSTTSRLASRSGASQLSLMHSGSMIDMHVGLEDRAEHRLNQAGFIPGTPIPMESPGTMSRGFYGFPGDGETPALDMASEQNKVVLGEGYVDPECAGPEGMRHPASSQREELVKRKKKGFRGFISKLTGSGASTPNLNGSTGNATGTGSIHGSIASRNASKRSRSSSIPRAASASLPFDPTIDPHPMPANASAGRLLNKARKSMSLFSDPTQPTTRADEAFLRSRSQTQLQSLPTPFQNPPGMASQTSLDLGPFQQPASAAAAAPTNGSKRSSHLGLSSLSAGLEGGSPTARRASNPLMQKYLNSPASIPSSQVPQSASGPLFRSDNSAGPNPYPAAGGAESSDVRSSYMAKESRANSFSPSLSNTNGDRRDSTAKTIPEGGGEDGAEQRSISSVGQSSLRKELPPMPQDIAENGGQPSVPLKQHSRSGSNGVGSPIPPGRQSMSGSFGNRGTASLGRASNAWQMSDASSRRSMQVSRPPIPFTTSPMTPQNRSGPAHNDSLAALPSDRVSIGDGLRRLPKSPYRADNMPTSPSFTSSADTEFNAGANQNNFGRTIETEFSAGGSHDPLPKQLSSLNLGGETDKEKNRMSRMLRLPFGRKKRESSVSPAAPSVFVSGGIENLIEAEPRKSSVGLGAPPFLKNRKSYTGLALPKISMQGERPRVLSSPADGRMEMPPRSHSAFGMLSGQRYASASEVRLSTDDRNPAFPEVEDEDDGDDGIAFERTFGSGTFGANGLTVPPNRAEGQRESTSGGGSSFGRKSLNLLREGFKMPVSPKQASPEQAQRKKRFGF